MIVLQTHDLSIGYHKPDVFVAGDINVSLEQGQLVCLLGPNGAGKSTLMRTLAGMQPAISGQVCLFNEDINRLKPRDRAQRLSVVLTERPNVGMLNGYALVALGRHPYTDWMGRLSPHDEAMIRWAVEVVGIEDIAERPVMELSDGQKQKVMIARALAQESDLILLDEPTAFLDLPYRVEIMQLLKHLAHETQRTILVSTHELDLALRSADALWLIANGKVIDGTPEDLVLSDQFEQVFRNDNIQFDKRSGTFSNIQRPRATIKLEGDGIPYIWTQRALERAGYMLANDADMSVVIEGDVWHLQQQGQTSTHDSIHTLLEALSNLKQDIQL